MARSGPEGARNMLFQGHQAYLQYPRHGRAARVCRLVLDALPLGGLAFSFFFSTTGTLQRSVFVLSGRRTGGATLTCCDHCCLNDSASTNTSAFLTPLLMPKLGFKASWTLAIPFLPTGTSSHKKCMSVLSYSQFWVAQSVFPFRADILRCFFLSLTVWYTLLSFYDVSGDFISRRHGINLSPTADNATLKTSSLNQADIEKSPSQVQNQSEWVCANCKKPASNFPDRTFKSCGKCRDTKSSVVYCSRFVLCAT